MVKKHKNNLVISMLLVYIRITWVLFQAAGSDQIPQPIFQMFFCLFANITEAHH